MKALRQIIIMAAAALVMASCDDESMNLDKTRIRTVTGDVNVVMTDSSYRLSWELPEIYTDKGNRALASNPEQAAVSYDVYLAPAYTNDTLVFITTVDCCGVELLFSEIEEELANFIGYRFGVSLSGSDMSNNNTVCYSMVQTGNNNTIDEKFETFNHWFTERQKNTGNDVVENDYIAKIESKSNSEYWDVQFCNVFRGLKNQKTIGNTFKLSFKVKWEGESSNPAYFTIYTGKYFYKKESKSYFQNSDDQWKTEINTQLTFENGWGDMNNKYQATRNEWTTVEFTGAIGELGTDIIAIQISLSGYYPEKYLNPNGTFSFKNMTVEIGDEVVAEYFMEK